MEPSPLAKRHDAEIADVTGRLFDALNEIKRLRAALEKISNDDRNCADHCRRQATRALGQRSPH